MTKILTAIFVDDNGNPVLAISPTIIIWDDNSGAELISGSPMTEIGGGRYKYSFASYDPKSSIGYRCDAGVIEGVSERYAFGSNQSETDSGAVWDELIADHRLSGTFGIINQDNYRGVGL